MMPGTFSSRDSGSDPSPAAPATGRWKAALRRPAALFVVLLVPAAPLIVIALLAMLRAPAAGMFHDDGIYVVTAKALATGEGYRIISMPGEPWQTKYPILFPAVLAVIWRIAPAFPDNLILLRMVPLAASIVWLVLSWFLLRRLGATGPTGAVIVLLVAMTGWFAFLSTALLSETLFAALLAGGLLVLTRTAQGDGNRFDPWLAGLLVGAAVLTRVAGAAPAAAGLLALALARRRRSAAQYLAGLALAVVPWVLWVMTREVPNEGDAYYSVANYGSWSIAGSYGTAERAGVLLTNLLRVSLAPQFLWGVRLPVLAALLAAIVFLVLLGRGLWRARREPAALATAATLAIVLAWVWPPLRFLVPVAPLLVWYAFTGAGSPRRAGAVLAVVLCLTAGMQLRVLADDARDTGASWFHPGLADDWNETLDLLDWISTHTAADAVLTGNLDPQYYLFTGRQAVRAFTADPYHLYYNRPPRSGNPLGTVERFCGRLRDTGADYLILQPGEGYAEMAHLRELVTGVSARSSEGLTVVAGDATSGHVIYGIERAALTCVRRP